jgi:RNA polymerase sigma-70 factor (ECF subfamily)
MSCARRRRILGSPIPRSELPEAKERTVNAQAVVPLAPAAKATTSPSRDALTLISRTSRADVMRVVYEDHRDALFSFALKKTDGDRESAEDVVQETMFRLWRRISRTDFDREVRPLLFTIARNILIDRHRARQARPRQANDAGLPDIAEADETENSLSRILVSNALDCLSVAHREAIFQTYLRDRKVQDTAQVLGVPQGTVKSRVYYALHELRETLTKQGVTVDDCAA